MGKSHVLGRPASFRHDAVETLAKSEPHLTADESAEGLRSSLETIFHYLKQNGKVSKLRERLPHGLSEISCQQRISMCTSLASRLERQPFLDHLIAQIDQALSCIFFDKNALWYLTDGRF